MTERQWKRWIASLPKMTKRASYRNGIGVFKGESTETIWIKIRCPLGVSWKGRHVSPGKSIEIKLGNLSSFSWEQAEEKRKELQGKADRGEALEASSVPLFSEYAKEWLKRLKARSKGYVAPEVHLNAHLLKQPFSSLPINALTVGHFNSYIAERLSVAKPATVKSEVSTLNRILNEAVRHGVLEANPGAKSDRIRGVVPRQRYLTLPEIEALSKAASEAAEWLPDFIKWLLVSGMRRGEALALKWSDVRELPNGQLVQIKNSKSGKPRELPCNRLMLEVLERQHYRRKDLRIFPISMMTLKRKWSLAVRNAELSEGVTVHDLRRTYATLAIHAGVDPRTLMGLLGHSNMRMLESVYAVHAGEVAASASTKVEAVFTSLSAPKAS